MTDQASDLRLWRKRYGENAVDLAGSMIAPLLVVEEDELRLRAVLCLCAMLRETRIVKGRFEMETP